MNDTPYIPRKTIEELESSHPEGSRHAAIIKIAYSLVGNGLPRDAIYATIRPKFPPDKTDREILDVIDWCIQQGPSPSVPLNGNGSGYRPNVVFPGMSAPRATPPPKKTKEELEAEALSLALDFISDDSIGIDETVKRSVVEIGDFSTHSATLFESLYNPDDRINIVCDYTVNEKGKANPKGGGKSLTRDEWVAWFKKEGSPSSKAGAWVRPNPCGDGTGKGGAIQDDDILRFEFMLIESDFLDIDVQLSLYAKWKLPIAAILTSGGDSAHAWVRISAPDYATYSEWVKRILDALKPFGFDQSNKNPSRLSRLPGAVRVIGASDEGRQRLLYVDPLTSPFGVESIQEFEKQVTPPFLNRYPLRDTALNSIERYDELQRNRGATGLLTGLKRFDDVSGGLKRGNMIVLAAETNVGKSLLALNIINEAINSGKTCALFSLEMDRDEIWDLLLSLNLKLDRNVFNTGNFSEQQMLSITNGSGRISRLPLHIFDDPVMTVDDIELACAKLIQDFNLQLVVVDYLQLVSPPAFFKDSREQQIAHIGRAIRMMAKKFKVPFIAVSQLNEDGKIRESRAVVHDAHIVLMLEVEENELRLRIAKGRSIPKFTFRIFDNFRLCKLSDRPILETEEGK